MAKLRTQHRTEYSPGIILDTGAHAVLLSTHLLGAAPVFVERTISRLHAYYPAVGNWRLFSELYFQDFYFHSAAGSAAL
jgi:hypothetical protein